MAAYCSTWQPRITTEAAIMQMKGGLAFFDALKGSKIFKDIRPSFFGKACCAPFLCNPAISNQSAEPRLQRLVAEEENASLSDRDRRHGAGTCVV